MTLPKSEISNTCNICKPKSVGDGDLDNPDTINWNIVNLLESDDYELLGSGDLVEENV